jgi:hypothetical protein
MNTASFFPRILCLASSKKVIASSRSNNYFKVASILTLELSRDVYGDKSVLERVDSRPCVLDEVVVQLNEVGAFVKNAARCILKKLIT